MMLYTMTKDETPIAAELAKHAIEYELLWQRVAVLSFGNQQLEITALTDDDAYPFLDVRLTGPMKGEDE